MSAERGRGRPAKPSGTAHVDVFSLKLSADEKALIKAAAEHAGKPVTQWAREALLATARSLTTPGQ